MFACKSWFWLRLHIFEGTARSGLFARGCSPIIMGCYGTRACLKWAIFDTHIERCCAYGSVRSGCCGRLERLVFLCGNRHCFVSVAPPSRPPQPGSCSDLQPRLSRCVCVRFRILHFPVFPHYDGLVINGFGRLFLGRLFWQINPRVWLCDGWNWFWNYTRTFFCNLTQWLNIEQQLELAQTQRRQMIMARTSVQISLKNHIKISRVTKLNEF